MRILLVEDDATLRRGLEDVLTGAGHQTVAVSDGNHADALLATEPFDLVILDLGLPGMGGLAVLKRLRGRQRATPVLVLSARDSTGDRVLGLDSGADDYLTKPFELVEFEARVRALLRRGQAVATCHGNLEWFWDCHQGRLDGQDLALSRHETVVLESLLRTPGKTISKEVLAYAIGDEHQQAADNLVEVYVHRLRRKLANSQLEIRTVRGLGYMLREN
jgi:DNA-binding response OmpR family regulator